MPTNAILDLFEPCYGPTAGQQLARYEAALTQFHALYGKGPVQIIR